MKRILFSLLFAACFGLAVQAQVSSCKAAYDRAQKLFEQEKWAQARDYFLDAKKKCDSDASYLQLCNTKIAECNKKLNKTAAPKQEASTPVVFAANTTIAEFPATGGTKTIQLSVSKPRTVVFVDYAPDWVTATVDNTNKTLTVTCRKNSESSAKKSLVTLDAGGTKLNIDVYLAKPETVIVRPSITLAADQKFVYAASKGETKTVKITTNSPTWKVISSPSWSTVTEGNTALTVVFQPNPSYELREGQIVVQAPDADAVVITVSQAGREKEILEGKFWGLHIGLNVSSLGTSFGDVAGSVFNYGYGTAESTSYKAGVGFRLGAFYNYPLSEVLYLRPAANLSVANYSNSFNASYTDSYTSSGITYDETVYEDFKEKYTVGALQIPVLLMYRNVIGENKAFSVGAGPYIALGLFGSAKLSGTSEAPSIQGSDGKTYYREAEISGNVNLFSTGGEIVTHYTTGSGSTETNELTNDSAPYGRFDFGLSLAASFEMSKLIFTVGYDFGLANTGNSEYFGSTRAQVTSYTGGNAMSDYSQHTRQFYFTVGYKF